MDCSVRIKRVKALSFLLPGGGSVRLDIPENLNQNAMSAVRFNDYAVIPMAAGRSVAESELVRLKKSGDVVGYLIPGQAIFSAENPNNSDPMFGAYSLIAAINICAQSYENKYSLASDDCGSATSADGIFLQGRFYAVVWLRKLKASEVEFANRYFVSFAKVGLYPNRANLAPRESAVTSEIYREVRLVANKEWPDYVREIMVGLSPFSENCFLRFFYLYQIIESLMSQNYYVRFEEIRGRLSSQVGVSLVQLRDYIEEFQGISKEKPRIKAALNPICAASNQIAESILTSLGESFVGLDFGENIYRVRNIIFHDYQRIRHLEADVALLVESLTSYILDTKLS